MTVLALTGATGAVGSGVARLLGPMVDRLLVRDPARLPDLPDLPADVVVADYTHRDASAAALTGVDILLMVSGAEAPDRAAQHRSFLTAAADAGVQHIVYTSSLLASPDAAFTLARDHWDTETAIRDSGMAYTILRNSFYSESLPLLADEHGAIRGPAGNGAIASVARRDVIETAAAVLRAPERHAAAVYVLTGPEALTLPLTAVRMSTALHRPFSFTDETIKEAYASRRHLTHDQYLLDSWVSSYLAVADGSFATITGDVQRVTGTPARTLEEALSTTT